MKLIEYRKISASVNSAIEAALKVNGLKLNGGCRATINEQTGEISIRLTVLDPNHKDASGNSITPEAARWNELASLYGLKPEWLGQSYPNGGRQMKIVGLRKGNVKQPVLLECEGKNYIVTCEDIQAIFALKEKQTGKAA